MNKVHIKTFGCQMNVYDSELVGSLLEKNGFNLTSNENDANIVLVNTCTIRKSADNKALNLMTQLIARKKKDKHFKIGLLGCMAENLGPDLQHTLPQIDLILGPDAYRDLPSLLRNIPDMAYIPPINKDEDYDNIIPVRNGGASTYLAISRGCDNKCTYCIIPSVRGLERSRPAKSIVKEVEELVINGFKEVVLIGQNVNSFKESGVDFPELLDMVSDVDGIKRVRFTTSHPKDLSAKLVDVIRDKDNVCSHVHLPVQSGSDKVLQDMGREYTKEHYLSLINLIKSEIPGVAVTTDIISGFPGETDEDHAETVDLLEKARYDSAFTFKYSPREGTPSEKMVDDVLPADKTKRLSELANLQREIGSEINKKFIGTTIDVMVETTSKRSPDDILGKSDGYKNVIITDAKFEVGSIVPVKIMAATSQTLIGKAAV